MIVESIEVFNHVRDMVRKEDSFWIPVYSDTYRHYQNNRISFIYIYCIESDLDYIIPFEHTDCVCLQTELIQELVSDASIFVLAKKRLQNTYSKPCYDADLFAWWHTGKMLPLDDVNTTAHDSWNTWWYNETNVNDWLPITKHIERCVTMRSKFMEVYNVYKLTEDFKVYDTEAMSAFGTIERTGIHVDYNAFTEHFKTNGIINNTAYTEYNLYTSTGRPSNKFNGINYAALNKEDGSRSTFISRHTKGMLVEFDFDAYHVRLIADLIGYTFPEGSVHTYLGRQYFDTHDLTDEQYEQSKQITFRLLYGGIDDEFAQIPFFGKTRDYIKDLWTTFRKQGVIHTPHFNRPMHKRHMPEMNANKLFNYLLQATETEHNIQVLKELHDIKGYASQLVLYTYDSVLFDFDMTDGKKFLLEIQDVMSSNGKFPVKIKAGINYHVMQDMTNRVS